MNKEQIMLYFHCGRCMRERPESESPREWARLNAGWTDRGMQVWCTRHDIEVIHIDLLGQQVAYAGDSETAS